MAYYQNLELIKFNGQLYEVRSLLFSKFKKEIYHVIDIRTREPFIIKHDYSDEMSPTYEIEKEYQDILLAYAQTNSYRKMLQKKINRLNNKDVTKQDITSRIVRDHFVDLMDEERLQRRHIEEEVLKKL